MKTATDAASAAFLYESFVKHKRQSIDKPVLILLYFFLNRYLGHQRLVCVCIRISLEWIPMRAVAFCEKKNKFDF